MSEGDACVAAPQGVVAVAPPAAHQTEIRYVAVATAAAPVELPSADTVLRARVASDGGNIAGRVLLGTVLSYAITLGFGLVTVTPFLFVCRTASCFFAGQNTGAAFSTLFGAPLGMLAAGAAFNGMGGYGWSMLGGFVGMLVSTPLSLFLVPNDPPGQIGLSIAYMAIPILSASLAYEISSANRARAVNTGRAFRPLIVPMALDRGAELMVGGAF